MKLLKGKKIAERMLKAAGKEIKRSALQPGLAVILVGNDKASDLYASLKKKAAEKIGIKFQLLRFSEKTREAEIICKIKELNADKKISGIIVQLPLPKKFNTRKIIGAIDLRKDVDGFSAKDAASLQPVFPQAIMEILSSSRMRLRGEKAAVIANSKVFGETMVMALENKGIRAGYILSKDLKNRPASIKNLKIVISAVGRPGFLKGEMLKKGAVVIDGGITKKSKQVLGDVDFDSVKNKISFLAPVPGGVGPVTIACLLKNTFLAAKKLNKKAR